jgi:hypothetical protein
MAVIRSDDGLNLTKADTIALVSGITAATSIFLFLEIFASLRQRHRRAPAFLNSSPEHRVRERHLGSDIFWRLAPRSPISEVSFLKLQLIWPRVILLLVGFSRKFC